MHEHPGWSGGVALSVPLREGGVMVVVVCGLVELIATAGLATDAPDEGSGPARRGWARLQHMSGSRVQVARHPWDRGRRVVAALCGSGRSVRYRWTSGGQGDQTTGRGGSGHRERAHGAGARRGRAGGVPAAVRADGGQPEPGGGGRVGRGPGPYVSSSGDCAVRFCCSSGGGRPASTGLLRRRPSLSRYSSKSRLEKAREHSSAVRRPQQ